MNQGISSKKLQTGRRSAGRLLRPGLSLAVLLVAGLMILLATPALAAWPNLPYGAGPGQWDTINELLQTAANYDFASGEKMRITGTVCGDVANASSVTGNGNYSKTGAVYGTEWVGATGPIHSTYTSQRFDCQWYTTTSGFPPGCNGAAENRPSDQLFVDIAMASNTAKALAPTQTFATIDTNGGNVTVTVVRGLNVINIPSNPINGSNGKLLVRGAGDLIISGPAGATVIFNVGSDDQVNTVSGGMDVTNSSIRLRGGVQAQNVLFNVLAGDVTASGVGDPVVINGSILVRAGSDKKGKFTGQGALRVNGSVLGDGNHGSEFSIALGNLICKHADRGDAPDTGTGTAPGNYNTRMTDSGPFHVVVPTLKLGAVTDTETDGRPTDTALGDDSNPAGGPDDEDGVVAPDPLTFATLSNPTITVRTTNTTGSAASLRCWMDLNRDGDFLDPREASGTGVTTVHSGGAADYTLSFGTLTSVSGTYLRCRLSTVAAGVASPTGPATSSSSDPIYLGEVEDYQVRVVSGDAGFDWGDAPDTGPGTGSGNYNTTLPENGPDHIIIPGGVFLGTAEPDLEFGELQNTAATADDLDTLDDEDGIQVPAITTQSTSVQLNVTATNLTGADGTLRCWIDFNRNGVFGDPGETSALTTASANSGTVVYPLSFTGFQPPVAGASYIRCRIAYVQSEMANPVGMAYSGEVEDFLVTIQ